MTSYDLIVAGGRLIDPANDVDEHVDISIAGGRIVELAESIPQSNAQRISPKGRMTPGPKTG